MFVKKLLMKLSLVLRLFLPAMVVLYLIIVDFYYKVDLCFIDPIRSHSKTLYFTSDFGWESGAGIIQYMISSNFVCLGMTEILL